MRAQQRAASSSVPSENTLLSGINGYRHAHGLPALAGNSVLTAKARSWAANMANGKCGRGGNGIPNICHSTLSSGITIAWSLLEENVGMVGPNVSASVMEHAFESSPSHSANMLNGKIRYMGVGTAVWNHYLYVAEEFMA